MDGMANVGSVVRHWGISVRSLRRPAAGTMNEIFIVDTDKARFVLCGHRGQEKQMVDFEDDVMERVRDPGIPAPRSLRTRAGQRVVRQDGRWWSLLAWIDGEQPELGQHTLQQA